MGKLLEGNRAMAKALVIRSPNHRQHPQKKIGGLSHVKLLHGKANIRVRCSEERGMLPQQHPSEMGKTIRICTLLKSQKTVTTIMTKNDNVEAELVISKDISHYRLHH